MEDEDAALAAGALLRAQQDADADAAQDDGEGGPPDDFVEIEHDGQFYKIPAALKGAFLMNADYTRKTQELAEKRRALEAHGQQLAQAVQAAQTSVEDRTQLAILDHQLEAFAGADWQTMIAEDPQRAQTLWVEFQQTQAVREQFAQSLARQAQGAQIDAERQLAAQMAQAGQVLSREIEGWSPEVANKLVEYAAAFGVTLDELREVADPRLWKILHRAFAGDEAGKQRQVAEQTERAQAVRPAVSVSGGASGVSSVRDELGTKEWMRRRNAQALQAR